VLIVPEPDSFGLYTAKENLEGYETPDTDKIPTEQIEA
jgi:hypothetical protein